MFGRSRSAPWDGLPRDARASVLGRSRGFSWSAPPRDSAAPVLVDQRSPCDCMRGAVATFLGLPYELTPDISGRRDDETFWSDWTGWLARVRLEMATFPCAPGHLERWIALVGKTRPGPLHAVVMSGTELLHDPAPAADRLTKVERHEVYCALVIGWAADPDWATRISHDMAELLENRDERVWALERLIDAPWNIDLLRMRGQDDEAEAMAERLTHVAHHWPSASIAADRAA
jgi:hypothetical protein